MLSINDSTAKQRTSEQCIMTGKAIYLITMHNLINTLITVLMSHTLNSYSVSLLVNK